MERKANPLTRRDFLQASAGAGAFAVTADLSPGAIQRPGASPPAMPGDALTGWFDRPMRWAQLTLVENDPGRFDPGFWLDYFARIRADAACLSAGGIVAYYPTEIPLHHRSAWLGTTDPFGELVAGCRRLNMHVIARTDPHAVRDEVRAAHPDWISVDADGQPRRHWANPELWVTCALGPYNFDFMDDVHREIVTQVPRRRNLHQSVGAARRRLLLRALPGELQGGLRAASFRARPTHATRRAASFSSGAVARLTELWKRWDGSIRAINPEARFIPNGPPDLKTGGELAHDPVRRLPGAPRAHAAVGERAHAPRSSARSWDDGRSAASSASASRSRIAGRTRCRASRRFASGSRRARPTACGPGSRSSPACSTTAAGCRSSSASTSGTHARTLSAQRVAARARRAAAVRPDGDFHAGVAQGDRAGDHVLGMYHALVEARVPFEMVHEALPHARPPRRVQAADSRGRGGALGRAVRRDPRVCRRGGSVLATFASSLYDEAGAAPDELRARGCLRRVVRRTHRRADAELLSQPRRRSSDRQAASRAGRPGRHAPHHQRRVPRARDADA